MPVFALPPLFAPRILLVCLTLLPGVCPAAAPAHFLLPGSRLGPEEVAVIVNDADPLSVRIGDYYRRARKLPADNVVHVRFDPQPTHLPATAFQRLRTAIEQATPARVQAYAITWAKPYRVDCMSITSALSFGFDRGWCSAHQCAPTRQSPYYGYSGASPWTDLGVRPTMSIAAENFADARALIDRGVAADGTRPKGTAYLVSTSDRARNVRAGIYPRLQRDMRGWIDTRVVQTNALRGRDDVMFYFTGIARVDHLDTLRFMPGAVADHLTSSGGRLTDSAQMSALRWLQAGATGSFGTVIEPCNLPGKFPNPALLMELYGSGRTLLQAYWASVQQPGEGIFIGEPLAAPYAGLRVTRERGGLRLRTRSLLPGAYSLRYADYPIGPWRALGWVSARHHQRSFLLPWAGGGYYRLRPLPPSAPAGAGQPAPLVEDESLGDDDDTLR